MAEAGAADVQNGSFTKAPAAVSSSLKPQLVVAVGKTDEAVCFYKAAFDAEELGRVSHPKRKAEQEARQVLCAELKIGSSSVLVRDQIDGNISNLRRSCRKKSKDNDNNVEELLYNSVTYYKKARRSKNGGCTNSRQQNKLDTNMFESYLQVLWRNTTKDEKRSFTCLDSLWFLLYKEGLADKGEQKGKVLRWILDKQIFSCKYVFVPIVCWGHWSLLILCHIGESIDSKTNGPCMLLLDSLEKTGPKRLEPEIRRFVWDIYTMNPSRRLPWKEFVSKIPLLVPKVPQQRNGDECGIFVLYYIYLFLKTAPEDFSLERYPYFLTQKWFDLQDLERFQSELYKEKNYIEID